MYNIKKYFFKLTLKLNMVLEDKIYSPAIGNPKQKIFFLPPGKH